MRKEKSCGACIFRLDNGIKWLVLRHNPDRGHHWDFPKGHVEPGETEEETAKREVYEECGIEIDIIKDFKEIVTFNPRPEIIKDVVYFVAKAKNTNVKFVLDEMCEYKWLSYEEAIKLLTFDNAKGLLEKANAFISSESLNHRGKNERN